MQKGDILMQNYYMTVSNGYQVMFHAWQQIR